MKPLDPEMHAILDTVPVVPNDPLSRLARWCKCGVSVVINEHRCARDTVMEYVDDFADEIPPDVLKRMEELDTTVKVQFYPHTPIGFYAVFHHDIDAALKEAVAFMESLRDRDL